MKSLPENVIKITGEKPGKTLAIFCGVHGNERAGIMAVDQLAKNLVLDCGSVYLVYANPRAIDQNVRFTESNLNREFIRKEKTTTYEAERSEELMDILDDCDALLDLHAYNESRGESIPFIFTESNAFDLVSKMDFGIIISNLDSFEKGGTDGYMFSNGKIGICAELGAINTPDTFVDLGVRTAYQFLQYFGCISETVQYDSPVQLRYAVCAMYRKQSESFRLAQPFSTFDEITRGQIVASEDGFEITAQETGCTIFPSENNPIGVEAFILAKKI